MNNLYIEVGNFRPFGSPQADGNVTVLVRDAYVESYFQFDSVNAFLDQFSTESELAIYVTGQTPGLDELSYTETEDGGIEFEDCGLQVIGYDAIAKSQTGLKSIFDKDFLPVRTKEAINELGPTAFKYRGTECDFIWRLPLSDEWPENCMTLTVTFDFSLKSLRYELSATNPSGKSGSIAGSIDVEDLVWLTPFDISADLKAILQSSETIDRNIINGLADQFPDAFELTMRTAKKLSDLLS